MHIIIEVSFNLLPDKSNLHLPSTITQNLVCYNKKTASHRKRLQKNETQLSHNPYFTCCSYAILRLYSNDINPVYLNRKRIHIATFRCCCFLCMNYFTRHIIHFYFNGLLGFTVIKHNKAIPRMYFQPNGVSSFYRFYL